MFHLLFNLLILFILYPYKIPKDYIFTVQPTMSSSINLDITNNKLKIKAVTYRNHSSSLEISELEIPVEKDTIVKPTEVLIQVKATAFNPIDCLLYQFSSNNLGNKKKVIGGDFAGIVLKAGIETSYHPGDKLYGNILQLRKRGSFSNFVIFEPNEVKICEHIPEGLSFIEAASLSVSLTSFQGLKKYNGDLKDKNILILGAGTNVGTYAIQFAHSYFKASYIVATCSSNSKEKAIKCGANLTIDYTKGEEKKYVQLLEFVKSYGKFDFIFDCVRDESVIDHFDEIMKPGNEGGICAQVVGSYVMDYQHIHVYHLLPSWKSIVTPLKYRIGLSKYRFISVSSSKDSEFGSVIKQLMEEDKLCVFIDSVHDAYTQFAEAYSRVASGKAAGKVVLIF